MTTNENPRFMTLRPVFLETADGSGPRRIEPGIEIEYRGDPGAALHPLNAAACAASARYDAANPKTRAVRQRKDAVPFFA
jgi:hypothetical protein